MRVYILEYYVRAIPPPKLAASFDFYIFCSRHVIHILGHIHLDDKRQRITQIWGHVGFNILKLNHGPPVQH